MDNSVDLPGYKYYVTPDGERPPVFVTFLNLVEDGTRLDLRTRNTSITEWEREDGKWRLLRYNDSAHLSTVAALD